MFKYIIFLALLLTVLLNGQLSEGLVSKLAHGVKEFSKKAQDSYESGRKIYEKIGSKVIEESYNMYCEHGGQGAEKVVQFVQCDKKHADEKYCEYANNGKMMFDLICGMAKEKGLEYFGNAMGCYQVKNKQDCFVVWFEQMKKDADMVKEGAETVGR